MPIVTLHQEKFSVLIDFVNESAAFFKLVFENCFRTLMEKARSMLSGAGLEQEFWVEAVSTTCYLVNRSPSSALDDTTPHEVWSGKKPSLQHLRVFGCDAYVHVPKENRSKLDNKAEKCIFIGYKDGVKGYKLWNPETKKIVYSRDVVFREVKDVSKQEFPPMQDEPEKIELELDNAKSESSKEEEAEEAEAEEEEPHTPLLRRSVRDRRQPERYSPLDFRSNFALSITDDDPRTVREAVNSEDSKLWKKAMVEEMDALDKNEAWDIVELPAGRKSVGSKWLFKKKFNTKGKVEKYKARLVAKGYSQVEGIDFSEIFSPVAKLTSIRFLLSITISFDLEVEQMDVKTTFLHGDLEEEIYMKQFSNTVFTPASLNLLTDMRLLASFGMCRTPGRVLILPSFSNNLTLPRPKIFSVKSSPKNTSPPSYFSYSENHSL
jgi:hypothetical protein